MRKFIFFILALSLITSCEDQEDFTNTTFNFAAFEESNYIITVNQGSASTQTVAVVASTMSSSARTYNVQVDPSSNYTVSNYTIPSTVTIPANSNLGTIEIAISDEIDLNGETLIINLNDEAFQAAPATISVNLFCPPAAGTWQIKIKDTYGDGWDGASILVNLSGNATTYTVPSSANTSIITIPIEVSSDATEFSIVYTRSSLYNNEHIISVIQPDGTVVINNLNLGDTPTGLLDVNHCLL